MKSNLKVLLLSVGVFVASIAASLNTVLAQSTIQTQVSSQSQVLSQRNIQQKNNYNHYARRRKEVKNKELNAFFESDDYDYWDARVLADYWKQSVKEAKARIGRKILWGPENVAILEQFLVDARTQALRGVQSASSPDAYKLYRESKYDYEDAADLAKFWGDRTPTDAKLRIERNLILGNEEIIDRALRFARS